MSHFYLAVHPGLGLRHESNALKSLHVLYDMFVTFQLSSEINPQLPMGQLLQLGTKLRLNHFIHLHSLILTHNKVYSSTLKADSDLCI